KATQAPLDCPEPDCSGKDCKTKTGSDGCLVCECGTSCPTLVCGPGCRPEVNVTQDRCPECVCDGDSPADGGHRNCPEVQCPADCEKEQVIPPHRCPWCLCHPITARKTLEKFGERHCPRELMEMLFRQADGLFKHTQVLREQLHYQDLAVRTLDGNNTGGNIPSLSETTTGTRGLPGCSNPECTGKDCRLVPGEDGCPRCSCGEAVRVVRCKYTLSKVGRCTGTDCEIVKKKADQVSITVSVKGKHELVPFKIVPAYPSESFVTPANRLLQRRQVLVPNDCRNSRKTNTAGRSSVFATRPQTTQKHDSDKFLQHGFRRVPVRFTNRRHVVHNVRRIVSPLKRDAVPEAGQVQCVVPVCEPYCKQRPAEHGCLVCDCPDVCPDIVCGAGCQPYFTDASRCERCVCNPHAGRDQMADVFASYCSEPTLHRMLADFGALERMMHDVQQQSFHHQHLITRAEQARGIHGPVQEELKALFARQQYERHHEPHRPQHAHVTPLPHQPYQTEEPSKPSHRAHKKHGGRRAKQDANRSS
ncbi:unnamed protein product, partial [Ixodes pacificus]